MLEKNTNFFLFQDFGSLIIKLFFIPAHGVICYLSKNVYNKMHLFHIQCNFTVYLLLKVKYR